MLEIMLGAQMVLDIHIIVMLGWIYNQLKYSKPKPGQLTCLQVMAGVYEVWYWQGSIDNTQ